MALAILHNVIIGQPVRLDACISKGEGCAKRTYNATLCNLASADLHTGINETVVVVGVQCLFALFFGYWYSSLPPQERGWQCTVERWQKQRKKYDSCKRRQCHRRQTKRWLVRLGLAKAVFFCVWVFPIKVY